MKILMLTPVFDTGGTETYIENLSLGLKKRGHSVMVASGGGKRVSHLDTVGIRHVYIKNLHIKGFVHTINSIVQLTKLIKSHTPDIIHTSSVYTTLIAKLSVLVSMPFTVKKPKVILTLHGGPTKDIEKKSAKILKFINVDTIAITNTSKKCLIRYGLCEKKIHQIYNGVDIEKFKEIQSNNLHHELTGHLRKSGKIILGYFGRLSEEKGINQLVSAMKDISESNKDIVLVILGEGHCRNTIVESIKKDGLESHIFLLGFQHNPYAIMNDCDLIILPSLWDTAPMVILEALALGKNVIANHVGGILELLGDTGTCVNPDNDSLISAILNFIKTKKHLTFNSKGQKRVELLFSLDDMVKNTEDVYFILNNDYS